MFQFRAFPSYTYLIQYMIHRYCLCVFPHSEISGSSLICSSPKLIAACHVLHRLLMPRHSPCALFSLTCVEAICTPLRPSPSASNIRSVPIPSPFRAGPACAGLRRETKGNAQIVSLWFSIKNYAGSTELSQNKIVFTLLKSSTIKVFSCDFRRASLLPCFFSSFLCSVFKVQLREYPQN